MKGGADKGDVDKDCGLRRTMDSQGLWIDKDCGLARTVD